MNSTNTIDMKCIATFYFSDPFSILLTVLRILISILYVGWFIFALIFKDFRNKSLIFLHNLNVIGLYNCVIGVALLFTNTCDVYSQFGCLSQSFNLYYSSILSGYGLAALALHRLLCVSFYDLEKKLSLKILSMIISLIWLIPLAFILILFFSFNSKIYYIKTLSSCLFDASSTIWSFIYLVFILGILPNFAVLTAYIWSHIKLSRLKQRANSNRSMSTPRITIQLVLYIFFYEINCVALLLVYYQTMMLRPLIPNEILPILRSLRWFHQFSPLALLYFHPVMLKKYRQLMGSDSVIISSRS